MTKSDKQILLDAAELIATGAVEYSCHAICGAMKLSVCDYPVLRNLFGDFYKRKSGDRWHINRKEIGKDHRVMLLLWFREVGLEGIEEIKKWGEK